MSLPVEEELPAVLGTWRVGSMVLVFWLGLASLIAASYVYAPGLTFKDDPDSAMRLVQVRDLIAGHGWNDAIQARIDPPTGASIHWSRLIDMGIAGLLMIGKAVFGDAGAEAFALLIWPLLLLLGYLASAVAVATVLGGRSAAVPTLLLSVAFLSPFTLFLPGVIDHHNAQVTLVAASVALALRMPQHPLFGLGAGLGLALSLAVGLETLPYVAALGAAIALVWAFHRDTGAATALFGLGFALAMPALFAINGGVAEPLACDALSLAYAAPALAAGLGLAAAAWLLPASVGVAMRLVVLAGLVAVAVAILAAIAPPCLSGPMVGVSAELKAVWLDRITEAQPIFHYFAVAPASAMATVGPPLFALGVAVTRFLRAGREARRTWEIILLPLAMAVAGSLYQVRTLTYANFFAFVVLGAWLAGVLRAADRGQGTSFLRIARLAGACLLAIPAVYLLAGSAVVAIAGLGPSERPAASAAGRDLPLIGERCADAGTAAYLDGLPKGVFLTPIFYGPTVLVLSGQSVLGAPYHRGGDAILATIRATEGSPDEARAVMLAHGVAYVAFCATAPDVAETAAEAPDGLLAVLLRGDAPSWLEPLPAHQGSMLRVFRVASPP